MFKNTFQAGFLSILYSIGSKPLQIWQRHGEFAAPVPSSSRPPHPRRRQGVGGGAGGVGPGLARGLPGAATGRGLTRDPARSQKRTH